jgi:uncharacterized protein (TIGR02266 family)
MEGKPEREHARYVVDLTVDCSTRDAFVSNRVTNLSRGGLFISSDQPLPIATEVDLTLRLPDTHTCITARGRVVWNYDIRKGTSRIVPGMGIRLLDLKPEEQQKLVAYLDTLPPMTASSAGS